MRVWCPFILLAALCSTVEAQAPAASACDLLTAAEVEAAAGWKPGAPKVATSAAFAERRIAAGKRTPEIATGATPLEGLGAPAIRSDKGSGPATIEAVTGGRILGVTAPTFEAAEALAKKAIPRVK